MTITVLKCHRVIWMTLLSSLPYLNTTTLKRHLFLASGDYGWNNAKLEQVPLLLTLGPKPEHKLGNIVIPYHNSRPEFQPSILQSQQYNFPKRTTCISLFLWHGDTTKDASGISTNCQCRIYRHKFWWNAICGPTHQTVDGQATRIRLPDISSIHLLSLSSGRQCTSKEIFRCHHEWVSARGTVL